MESKSAAQRLISRSILGKAIYRLYGTGLTYQDLHADVLEQVVCLRLDCGHSSFRVTIDSFRGSRSLKEQVDIVESFAYLDFQGPIQLKGADEDFTVFEEYDHQVSIPRRLFFGRLVAAGGRDAINTLSLKKRRYISTTSMDAELALLAANLTLVRPGKVLYDPFVGTGSLTLAAAHFGALVLGSDIDGRSIRGTNEKNLLGNFEQYGLTPRYLGSFISDLTHSPVRNTHGGWIHGLMCDPPYGVREGLKVLGSKHGSGKGVLMVNGRPAHL